jgi:dihydrofolate reductase
MTSAAVDGPLRMAELRVHNISGSLDGYAAGPGQSMDESLGVGGERLHDWMFSPDATEADLRFRRLGQADVGATIMGRTMFGTIRGTTGGPGSGARTRRSTTTSSSPRTTRAIPSPWPVAPPSTS